MTLISWTPCGWRFQWVQISYCMFVQNVGKSHIFGISPAMMMRWTDEMMRPEGE